MRSGFALLVLWGTAMAQSLGLQVALGFTGNVPTDVRVVQQGFPSTVVEGARFEGRDLEGFPYYTVRLWYGERVGLIAFPTNTTHRVRRIVVGTAVFAVPTIRANRSMWPSPGARGCCSS